MMMLYTTTTSTATSTTTITRNRNSEEGVEEPRKMLEEENSDSDDESSCGANGFSPREEIVIMCPTISGHSGGPCVNDEGKVIGILSRADPVESQRCYLAPTNELKSLVNKAKSSRATGGLKAY